MDRQKYIHAQPRADFDAVEGAGRHPKRRQRLLHRLGIDDHFGDLKKLAVVNQLFVGPSLADHFHRLGHDLMGRFVVGAETLVGPAVRVTAAAGKLHAPAADQIQHRRLFGQLNRMVHRQSVDRDTEAQAFGALRHRAKGDIGRRHQGKLRLAMDLGDPIGVIPQAIGKLSLLHELGQALHRRSPLRTLDFSK